MNTTAVSEPESLPSGAQTFAGGESLANRLKGDKAMAVGLAPLGLIFGGLMATLVYVAFTEAKSAGDYIGVFVMALLCALPVIGCIYPLRQLYKSAEKMQLLEPLYRNRAIVVTPDYLEFFTGTLEEHERGYYAKRMIPVVRIPWNTIQSFTVGHYKSGKHSHTRGYVVKAEGLPDHFTGQIRVLSAHFQENEIAILEVIAPRLRVTIEYRS